MPLLDKTVSGGVHRRASAGGVLIDSKGQVLLREPKGHYGSYVWTFAKGGLETGETAPRAALREVREETGWAATIVARLGVFLGDTSETTYFLMRPLHKVGDFDAETASIKWVSREDAERMLNMTGTAKGKIRDLAVLKLAYEAHMHDLDRRTADAPVAESSKTLLEQVIQEAADPEKLRVKAYYQAHQHVIDTFHKQTELTFTAMNIYAFHDRPGINLYKSPTRDRGWGRPRGQSSEYRLIYVSGVGICYARKSNHWGYFSTHKRGEYDPEAREYPDIYTQHTWNLQGGRRRADGQYANTSQAGYVVVEPEKRHEHIHEDAFSDALVNGKAVLIRNVWWAIASRDLKENRVLLTLSKYAAADGHEPKKPISIPFTTLVRNIRSGKWGANVNGRRYGPKQDREERDHVRKAAGLSAAPGSARIRAANESESDDDSSAATGDNVATYLQLYIAAEDHSDAAEFDVDNDRRRLEDEAGVYWARAMLQWELMTDEEQAEAWKAIDDGTYREQMNAPARGIHAREIFLASDDITVRSLSQPPMPRTLLVQTQLGEAAIPKAVANRESRLRKRGFTYRANPEKNQPRKGYPPMVRKWAHDEGFPLAAMQRMWDMAVEDVDSGGELDRPAPGKRGKKAVEFWKEVTRQFRGMVAVRKQLEADQ